MSGAVGSGAVGIVGAFGLERLDQTAEQLVPRLDTRVTREPTLGERLLWEGTSLANLVALGC